MEHIAEDNLERYLMKTPPEAELGRVEEHLLICHECQNRLQAMDEYVTAMKSAAAEIIEDEKAVESAETGETSIPGRNRVL